MKNLKPILILLTLGIFLFTNSVYSQDGIDFIHGKWNLNKKTVNGKVELDYSKISDSNQIDGKSGDEEMRNQRYIHFFRGNFGQNSGTAVYNLLKSDKQFSLSKYLGKECVDSIRYNYLNKVILGYSWQGRKLIMRMNMVVIDSNTIELISITTNSANEEKKTSYILKRDQKVNVGLYLPWSPNCSIILRQNGDNYYASSIGASIEKEILIKKKDFSIVINSIPQKTSSANFGIHIVFSESPEAKKLFKEKLNQENNPYLKGSNYFESTILGYNNLNISKSNKTHFLYYASDKDRCGEAIGSWMNLITEWKVNTFYIDESYQVKRNMGSIKKLPYDSLYMHVFFDSNQNGVIENAEYSCTKIIFD